MWKGELTALCIVLVTFGGLDEYEHEPFRDHSADATKFHPQIEQFIESIFPSQTAATYRAGAPVTQDEAGTTLTVEEQEAKKKQQAQDKEEFFYIALAVGATLLVITSLMVCLSSASTDTEYCLTASHSSSLLG